NAAVSIDLTFWPGASAWLSAVADAISHAEYYLLPVRGAASTARYAFHSFLDSRESIVEAGLLIVVIVLVWDAHQLDFVSCAGNRRQAFTQFGYLVERSILRRLPKSISG